MLIDEGVICNLIMDVDKDKGIENAYGHYEFQNLGLETRSKLEASFSNLCVHGNTPELDGNCWDCRTWFVGKLCEETETILGQLCP